MSVKTGSIGEVLRVALPLIAASMSMTVKLFCDRAMLAHYDEVAIEAAFPAGLSHFMFMTFFIGLASYAQTFVAQFKGDGRTREAGVAVWQGIFIALVGGCLLATGPFWARWFFDLFRHAPETRAAEVEYFSTIARFSVFYLLSAALSGFWSGRGMTAFIMIQGFLTATLNLAGNWLLIFGHLGLPEMGIAGAALATGLSEAVGTLLYLVIFLRRRNRQHLGSWPRRCFRPSLCWRLIRFGAPRGFHFFMDIASFNAFVLLMGLLATRQSTGDGNAQEAINIVFAVNATAFFPLMGLGQAVSILVGQGIGAKRIGLARRAVRSAVKLALMYTALMGLLFVMVPGFFLAPFVRLGDVGQVATMHLATIMLWFAATWGCFDAIWIMTMSALQGAGDTRFCMTVTIVMALTGLVLPSILVVHFAADLCAGGIGPIWVLWSIFVAYVIIGSAVFGRRYRRGRWESMSVLGPAEVSSPLATVEIIEALPPGGS